MGVYRYIILSQIQIQALETKQDYNSLALELPFITIKKISASNNFDAYL